MENVTILTIPLRQHHGNYNSIWLGIANIQTTIYVGLQQPDGFIWPGLYSYDNKDRGWPEFINAWYIANIYLKALEKYVGTTAPLLSKCSSVFKINKVPYQFSDSKFVLRFLPNGQKDVDDLLEQLPPIEYIEKVVSLAKKKCLFFDSSDLRIFLGKYEKVPPSSLLEKLEEYENWRTVLLQNS